MPIQVWKWRWKISQKFYSMLDPHHIGVANSSFLFMTKKNFDNHKRVELVTLTWWLIYYLEVQVLIVMSWSSDWLLGLDVTTTMLFRCELMRWLDVSCHSMVYCQVMPIWLGCKNKWPKVTKYHSGRTFIKESSHFDIKRFLISYFSMKRVKIVVVCAWISTW